MISNRKYAPLSKVAATLSRLCLVFTVFAITISSRPAFAQQPINPGPPPFGGPRVAEFLVPPGSLGQLIALAQPGRIMYDIRQINIFGGTHSPFFRFIRAHEYAHLRRRHFVLSPQDNFDNELEADCDAAELFGWNSPEVQAAAHAYRQRLPPQNMPGSPGSAARIANLRDCGR